MTTLTGHKDTDREILLKLNNDDVLNYCNNLKNRNIFKQVCNDDFFKSYMTKHYPKLLIYKPFDVKWKLFYLKTVYHISKLKEDFNFEYTNNSKGYPKEYYDIIFKYKNPEVAFEKAVRKGYKDLAEYFNKDLVEYYYNDAFIEAVKNNDDETIKYLIELGGNEWDLALLYAANNGNMDFVDFFLQKGADINYGLTGASLKGDIKLINYFLDKGAEDLNDAVAYASKGGSSETVSYLVNKALEKDIDINWNRALNNAARKGNLNLVEYFIDVKGADDLNNAMTSAIIGNHYDVVKYLISKGANMWDYYIHNAKKYSPELVKLFENKK